jgi:hypothetical protein
MLLPKLDYYPIPEDISHIDTSAITPYNNECRVTFEVRSEDIPADAHVYVTGDHGNLGPWRPDELPLRQGTDGSWSRSFIFDKGDSVRYIFTLGSWKNEMKLADGETPDVRKFAAADDTTIVVEDPEWGMAKHDIFVNIILAYFGSLITIILMLVYGQFIFSWESSYFDLVISQPVNIETYLNSKYSILSLSGIFTLIIFIPLFFLSTEIFLLNSSFAIYNIGVNTIVLLAWSTLSRKRFDLNASLLSTQGKGGSNFAAILPTVIVPVIIYVFAAEYFSEKVGMLILTFTGILGFIFRKILLKIPMGLFHKQKYNMAIGFREK